MIFNFRLYKLRIMGLKTLAGGSILCSEQNFRSFHPPFTEWLYSDYSKENETTSLMSKSNNMVSIGEPKKRKSRPLNVIGSYNTMQVESFTMMNTFLALEFGHPNRIGYHPGPMGHEMSLFCLGYAQFIFEKKWNFGNFEPKFVIFSTRNL